MVLARCTSNATPEQRLLLVGMAMGLTAISIVYSPWGKQSGAHLNPSVTLAFFRLGKIASWDAFFYVTAQFVGGISNPTLNLIDRHLARGADNRLALIWEGEDGQSRFFTYRMLSIEVNKFANALKALDPYSPSRTSASCCRRTLSRWARRCSR